MPSQASRRKPLAALPTKAALLAATRDAPTVGDFMAADGRLDLDQITAGFNLTKSQLAETAGLASDTLQKSARRDAPKTQARVTEVLEILSRLETWAGGRGQALAWYRAQPIAALDGRTAEALVKSGKASVVRDYLDHLALGGFA
jgi:uncharacterized protein (DUF2384 family)